MKTLLLVLALVALPVSAQRARSQNFASDFQTVPVMANVTGVNNVRFHSYVALLNPTSSAFGVEATLYDANGTTRTATIQLAAGEQKTYDNFLETIFQYSGGGAVTFRSPNANNRFILGTEVRTTPGSYSTMVPPLEFAGSSSRAFAEGVSVDATSRTNIGCFNQSALANTISVTVYANNHVQVGTTSLSLAPNAWGQTAITAVVPNGYIQFDPAEAAVCYAVVVSNATGDGRFINATEYLP
ncbi:MAG TPA: hypothetical protein VHK90_06990 [Thermoanaerobaculia bacterium]|nr:hypothetical protein [Thermoanaerobaculia bacterium]